MAVDNPSYFSLSSAASSSTTPTSTTSLAFSPPSKGPTGLTALFRRRPCKMGTTSSASVLSTSTTSTLMHQESNRSSTSGNSTPSTPTEERVPMLPRNGMVHPGNGAHGPTANQRRSFRNLFRSVSANADNERTQQFLKGDPRPSDVAPPSPYLPHRSHSHSENDRRRPGRSRAVLKSASELLSNDMVYCGLARDSHDQNVDDDDDDDDDQDSSEVFVGVEDARYYNLSATLPAAGSAAAGRRRHSIGTFLGKDRSTTKDNARRQPQSSTALVEPDTMAPPIPVDVVDGVHVENRAARSYSRTRRRRHRSSSSMGSRSATGLSKIDSHPEDDVLFVSSKDSEISSLWVNYLTACFEQISRQQGRPPFKVRHITVEESPAIEERIRSARLQIVVVCPVLLERIQSRPEQATNLSRQLIADKVLAMMLGVHDSHITDTHKSILVSYNQWRKFFVKDQDETFVGELLGAAVGILGTTPPPALRSDKTAFSVHPKKVKLGHNRIIALLNDPMRPEDNVSVIVDRCGEAIDIAHVKRRNPYTLQFSIPERCLEVSMLVGVRISKNGCPLGVKQVKCESRLRELDQILRAHDNPLEFMCQTFGFNPGDREQLDNWMVHAFQRNVPPHFNLLSTPSGVVSTQRVHSRRIVGPEENPTLLHFAARFGLERLAWQLLECPGGDIACDLRNVSELTPADLAEQAGHARLAHQLRGYMQMNEFTNMYSYLKVISETTDQPASADPSTTNTTNDTNDKEDYCRPRPLSEAYSVPPAARPITSLILPGQLPVTPNPTTSNPIEANYSIVPAPTPVVVSPSTPTPTTTIPNGLELPLQGYMKMHPAGTRTPTSNIPSQQPSRTATPTQNRPDHPMHTREENSQSSCSYGRAASNFSTKSREPSGPQDELLEIINDFKNNVFTITEVERLVENWRNRNDVQQSFKDKQRQLNAMREEYERIQKKLKDEMKAPTPFDRIRKFFSKGKKDSKDSANGSDDSSSTNKPETVNGALTDRRPVSSLSLRSVSSSSSSGRMSTASGCSGTSLGDSGTHSDTEDRRLQNAREDKAGVMSYEIPPAPKPFTGRYSPALRYSPSPRSLPGNDLDLRPSHLASRTEDNEYYIAFPPSGLPIHSFKPEGSLKEPKTPNSPCDHPKYLDMIQNSSPAMDTPESESCRQPGNSYANIEPSTLNSTPIPPPGMCIPTNYMNVAPACVSSFQEPVQEQTEHSDSGHASELSKNSSKETHSEEEKASGNTHDKGQHVDDVRGKENEEYVETDSVNGSEGVDVPDTCKMPEYMNVDVSQDVKVKKTPAPPVPPRVSTKK
nr:PREDICTED: phosphoinositide 3-kinase adapter protein 1 isoform X2 [Megachile rotundata]